MTGENDLLAMILTHGRPDDVITYDALKNHGYSGEIVLVCDDEDDALPQYVKRYGKKNVEVINLNETAKRLDIGDSIQHHNSVVYKRVAAFDIAQRRDYKYLWQLDDDYTSFYFRKLIANSLRAIPNRRLDETLRLMIEWLETSNAATVAMAQPGELIGGATSALYRDQIRRKAMNSWLFRTDRPIPFMGRLNDDVNTYVMNGQWGELIMTPFCVAVYPVVTQRTAGGMTELYLDTGTYMKSFYTVMMAPSAVEVRTLGPTHPRAHHHIKWNHLVPKIIEQKHRKP